MGVALVAACAEIGSPGGGPEDVTPPKVIKTFPDSGAVRVPPTDSLVLKFSKPMSKRSVEESFFLSPPVEYRERFWKKNVWILRTRVPLARHRTYAGLLGTATKDHHNNALKEAWSFAFSTGDTLDTGKVKGEVFGQRYSPKGLFVYVWPWSVPMPDTSKDAYLPDPLRLGQTDADGKYELDYLPRNKPLRICAFYDRDKDLEFNRSADRLACLPESLVIEDTSRVVTDVNLYVADPDEPGTVAGTVADSVCLRSKAGKILARVRSEKDSLHAALSGTAEESPKNTPKDSVAVGRQLLGLDSLATGARAESLFCIKPIRAQLISGDTTIVRETVTKGDFRWPDVPPGVYKLRAFRDLNNNGVRDPDDPVVLYRYPLEVKPLHVLDKLDLNLPRTAIPDTSKMRSSKPDTTKAGAPKPGSAKPDTTRAGAPKPGSAKPDTTKTGLAKPGLLKSDTTKVGSHTPGSSTPDTTKVGSKPDTTKVGVHTPGPLKPDTTKVRLSKPNSSAPDSSQSAPANGKGGGP